MSDELDDLRDTYLTWTRESLEKLDGLLVALAGDGDADATADEIFAIVHNIKGMGTSFGFQLMTDSGHLLCDYLRIRPKGVRADAAFVTSMVKAMHVIIDNNITGDGGPSGARLIEKLTGLQADALIPFKQA